MLNYQNTSVVVPQNSLGFNVVDSDFELGYFNNGTVFAKPWH
ncbi:MAG: hypothetical protein ABFD02_16745 [Bacteroidales bacterium]